MSTLQTALECIGRGWHIFPLKPRTKDQPLTAHGDKDASNDEARIRAWWAKTPDANVAIATGPSGLTVCDVDLGLVDEDSLRAFMAAHEIPETLAVRTGRRPEYRVQLYFTEPVTSFNGWQMGEHGGDIRGSWGYVLAPGSIHPSGETYSILWDKPIAPVPNFVRALKPHRKERVLNGNEPITEWRNDAMVRILGKMRNAGLTDELVQHYAYRVNAERMQPPLDDEELERIVANVCKYPVPELEPEVIFGGKQTEPSDPWAKYHTPDQVLNARPVTFLIDEFLTEDAITVIAAPVAQRKSIIALNVVHSLVTGAPLFEHFAVKKQPTRVLYCCPEMGIQSFSARLKSMGLAPHLGKTLFCTTMASDPFELKDITPDELKGAVVVLDTAIRFLRGDESNAAEMAVFAATVFRLIKDGAASVLLLHHSKKGTSEATELTLDNVMRGSGELGAFVACVWATRLQDGKDEYNTPSYLENVKKRDFDSKPFQVLPVPGSYRLVYDAKIGVELNNPSRFRRDKDGKEAQALALIAAARQTHPTMSYVELSRMLQGHGIDRSSEWIRKRDKRGAPTTGVGEPTTIPTTNTP